MSDSRSPEAPSRSASQDDSAPVGFSGSYAPEDVTFLLQRVEQPLIDVASKERLLQSRERHYSELLSPEHAPSAEYLAAFERACASNGDRLASDVLQLARIVADRVQGKIALVSLARAGTPIGVLLRRALTERFGREVVHFSISIIAGRGVDEEALDVVRAQPGIDDAAIVFVDGWTGKGVIGRALTKAVTEYNASRGARLDPTLHVVVDLCGSTQAASTANDYLIPSCLLGATVSGLVSRSILNEHTRASGRFHGCRYYEELEPADRSRPFVDELHRRTARLPVPAAAPAPRDLAAESARSRGATARLLERYGYTSDSLLKPGLGESTRVLLRRVPGRLIVRSDSDPEIVPILLLAEEKRVAWSVDPDLPWRTAALIAEVSK
jgi:hypothetical protein